MYYHRLDSQLGQNNTCRTPASQQRHHLHMPYADHTYKCCSTVELQYYGRVEPGKKHNFNKFDGIIKSYFILVVYFEISLVKGKFCILNFCI
jgi:hypothetical protein